MPIHLFEKDNKCFNVQSDWTAAQILDYKLKNLDMYAHIDSYALFEVVRNGSMERRICSSETLTSIVLVRWLEWEHSECYVLLKKDPYPFQPQVCACLHMLKINMEGHGFRIFGRLRTTLSSPSTAPSRSKLSS